MQTPALQFENTAFDVIDRSGEPWLRLSQIGTALGYSRPDAINNLYQSNSDEFTEQMTNLIKLPDLQRRNDVAGQLREVRIFSLRGCHLLAMLARTEKSKAFRRWVLDILDNLNHEQNTTADLITVMREMVSTQKQTLSLIENLTKKRGGNSRPPIASDINKIKALKADGCPQTHIARTLGLSNAAVSLILNNQYRINEDQSVNVGAAFFTA